MPDHSIPQWQSLTTADVAPRGRARSGDHPAAGRHRATWPAPAAVNRPRHRHGASGQRLPSSAGRLSRLGASSASRRVEPGARALPGHPEPRPRAVEPCIYQYGVVALSLRHQAVCYSATATAAIARHSMPRGCGCARNEALLVVKVSYFDFLRPEILGSAGLGMAARTARRGGGNGDDDAPAPRSGSHGRDWRVPAARTRARRDHAAPAPGRSGLVLMARRRSQPLGRCRESAARRRRMGERLVAHYGEALAEAIRDARAFPLDRLV